jgi:hypothetical protein
MALMRPKHATLVLVLAFAGCGSDDMHAELKEVSLPIGGTGATTAGAGAPGSTGASVNPATSQPAPGMTTVPNGGQPAITPTTTPSTGGAPAPAAAAGAQTTAGAPSIPAVPPPQPAASGAKDGDPTKPIFAIPSLPCGPSQAGFSGGNYEFGGRKLIVDYPCDKHEGAHVTIILNLHGTLIMGASYAYQHAYFSAHKFVNSHNLIVLTPQSVSTASYGAQWGNMDEGKDLPYLLQLVDWAYTTFNKFQIRGLWIGGHSWGAAFVTAPLGGGPFACNPMIQDKVKGAIGMSRLSMPSCASRLSLIATRGEMENIPLLDQSSVAMGHGCKGPMAGPKPVGNNEYRYFEGCSPGWVHEDYMMTGKGHIDNMDQEVVKNIVDAIKSTEQ